MAVAVVATPLQWHAAEALLEVDMRRADMLEGGMLPMLAVGIPVGPMLEVHMPAVAMPGQEWGRIAFGVAGTSPAPAPRIVPGTVAIGVAEIGTAGIGAGAIIGTAAAVTGEIRMANGDGGMGTGGVIPRTNVVFIGDFGFPWWWGWGWGPWAGYGWGYPYGYGGYGYYGYDDPYYGGGGYPYYGYGNNGYGNGYGAEYQSQYGGSSQSRVAELQQRLSRAGYYHGSVDGVLGPQTRRAIRAYEQEHGDVG